MTIEAESKGFLMLRKVVSSMIFKVSGMVILGLGLFLLYNLWQLGMASGYKQYAYPATPGQVEQIRTVPGLGKSSYEIVVRFATASGKRVRTVGATLTTPSSYSVGKPVTIRYNPEQPEDAVIETADNPIVLLFLLILMGTGGVIVCVMGALMLFAQE